MRHHRQSTTHVRALGQPREAPRAIVSPRGRGCTHAARHTVGGRNHYRCRDVSDAARVIVYNCDHFASVQSNRLNQLEFDEHEL